MIKLNERGYKILLGLLGHLPMWFLYGIANLIYIVIAYLIPYRKKVIDENLLLVFPEKTLAARKAIRRKYYRHLADFIIELLVCVRITPKQLNKRMHYVNPELINDYYKAGRQVVSVLGHYANWEWGFGFPLHSSHTSIVVYKEMDDKAYDEFQFNVRSRFGAVPISMGKVLRLAVNYIKQDKKVFLFLLADQSPAGNPNTWHFTKFLGVDGTPVFLGPEKIAQALDAVFVFTDVRKVRRGHYEVKFITLCKEPRKTAPLELTQLYFDYLEKQIREEPEYWMWSHRRWKRRRLSN